MMLLDAARVQRDYKLVDQARRRDPIFHPERKTDQIRQTTETDAAGLKPHARQR